MALLAATEGERVAIDAALLEREVGAAEAELDRITTMARALLSPECELPAFVSGLGAISDDHERVFSHLVGLTLQVDALFRSISPDTPDAGVGSTVLRGKALRDRVASEVTEKVEQLHGRVMFLRDTAKTPPLAGRARVLRMIENTRGLNPGGPLHPHFLPAAKNLARHGEHPFSGRLGGGAFGEVHAVGENLVAKMPKGSELALRARRATPSPPGREADELVDGFASGVAQVAQRVLREQSGVSQFFGESTEEAQSGPAGSDDDEGSGVWSAGSFKEGQWGAAAPEDVLAGAFIHEDSSLEKVRHEAEIHARVSDLEGVISLIGMDGEMMLLERADGGTVSDIELTPSQMRFLATTFAEMHARHIVHRDIKGGNILVTHDGGLRVADFGGAEVVDAQGRVPEMKTAGTVTTMAPEVVRRTDYNLMAADVYSLGATFYRSLTGRYPHGPSEGSDFTNDGARGYALMTGEPDYDRLPATPVGNLIRRMLAMNPEERPRMAEVAEELVSIEAAEAIFREQVEQLRAIDPSIFT